MGEVGECGTGTMAVSTCLHHLWNFFLKSVQFDSPVKMCKHQQPFSKMQERRNKFKVCSQPDVQKRSSHFLKLRNLCHCWIRWSYLSLPRSILLLEGAFFYFSALASEYGWDAVFKHFCSGRNER